MISSARLGFTSLLVLLITVSVGLASSDISTTSATVMKGLTSMPLAFTENQGQWDEKVLFRANAGGATMWFTHDGAYYQFTRRIPSLVGRNPRGFDNSIIPTKADHDVGTTGV
jgi:hypothetical protein